MRENELFGAALRLPVAFVVAFGPTLNFFCPFVVYFENRPRKSGLHPLLLSSVGQRRWASSDRWRRRPQAAEVHRGWTWSCRWAGLRAEPAAVDAVHAPCVDPRPATGIIESPHMQNMRWLIWIIPNLHTLAGHLNVDAERASDAVAME